MVIESISTTTYSYVAYWKQVGSGNADLKKSVKVGTSMMNGSVFSSATSVGLTIAAEAGVNFLGTGGKVKVSSTLTATFTAAFL